MVRSGEPPLRQDRESCSAGPERLAHLATLRASSCLTTTNGPRTSVAMPSIGRAGGTNFPGPHRGPSSVHLRPQPPSVRAENSHRSPGSVHTRRPIGCRRCPQDPRRPNRRRSRDLVDARRERAQRRAVPHRRVRSTFGEEGACRCEYVRLHAATFKTRGQAAAEVNACSRRRHLRPMQVGVWEICRYCGRERKTGEPPWSDLTCPRCAGSPLCARCGHPRGDHARVFTNRPTARCDFVAYDVQALMSSACDCDGFVPVEGSFADAAFANADDDLPPLRIVPLH